MCKCTPDMRTPFCGKGDCQWPPQEPKAPDVSHPIGADEHGLIYDIVEERRMRRHREAQLARCTETMRRAISAMGDVAGELEHRDNSWAFDAEIEALNDTANELSEARAAE